MRFAIFYNPQTNPDNKTHALAMAQILEKQELNYVLNPDMIHSPRFDVALAVGGDGTMLYASNLLAHHKTPILGINFGHRGYLCEATKEQAEAAIRSIATGRYRIEEKTRIQAEIKRRQKIVAELEALNEISIGGINRTVHIHVEITTPNETIQASIAGDGLIVATQTGSTAYNINAGGPKLLTEALSIVANNAFFESDTLLPITKSLVAPSQTVIKIEDSSRNRANLPYVIADGQDSVKMDKNDLVVIKMAKYKNYFVKL